MKTILQKAIALPVIAMALSAAPALAQSKGGLGIANLDKAVNDSTAAATARSQMQVTYKATIDSFNTRKAALDAELKQKADALQAAAKAAGGKSTPALQAQYEALQKRSQEAQAELQRVGQPLALANAYVEQQLAAKLTDAVKAAMTKKGVDLVLQPEAAVSYQPAADITAAVTAELNTLVPSVGIVPPAGWQPGQQQAAGGAAPAAGGR